MLSQLRVYIVHCLIDSEESGKINDLLFSNKHQLVSIKASKLTNENVMETVVKHFAVRYY